MYYDHHYESALDAGVELLSKPAPGLLVTTVDADDRDAMQAQARAVLEQLRAFYAAPVDDARGSLQAAIERLADLAFTCAEDTALTVVDSVHAFGCHLEDLAMGHAQVLVLPPLATLEQALQNLIGNVVRLETERERERRHREGFLTFDEWQCERDTRETWRALDAQFSADNAADCHATCC